MAKWHVLDLFSGLGGFSAAFEESDRWTVTTVDIEDRFNPDVRADVMDLRPADLLNAIGLDREDIDVLVILASPPCTEFSIAASYYEKIVDGEPQTPAAREAITLVYHTLGLIHALSPDYWFLENPRGYLRQFIGAPTATVTYCQYGEDYMKPTDLWGDHPPNMSYLSCSTGDDCHAYNTSGANGGLGNCDVIDKSKSAFQQSTSGTKADVRALVPYELSEAIRDAVEAVYDGETYEQVTFTEVVQRP